MLIRLLRQFLSGLARSRVAPADYAAVRAHALGLHREGKLAQAESAYRSILVRVPDDAVTLGLFGHCLLLQGRFAEAVDVLTRAVAGDPASADALFNLAVAYKSQRAFAPALANVQKALGLRPAFVEARLVAAEVCLAGGDYAGAEAQFRAALELQPDHLEANHNFGVFLYGCGRPAEAIECFRRAIAANPAFAPAHGYLVAVVSGAAGWPPAEIYREQRVWAARFAEALTPSSMHYANRPEKFRRLRIGYVSPDLCTHPIANFFEPLLERHDRAGFESFCYYTGRSTDPVNQRLRGLADGWIDCAELDDIALARQIQADRIDVLVDLSAHTKGHRLAVFARRPAPLQVSYLGYPTSTGIAAIDYRISDHQIDPDPADPYSAEKVLRLPATYYCFRHFGELPPVGPLPALENGFVTFGSFNNLTKLDPDTLALWAQVLAAVPASRLILKTRSLGDSQMQQQVAAHFSRRGIDEGRLMLRGWEAQTASHLAHYNNVDIALDPAHYNGATTTCEALLMGVPVATRRGNTHMSRLGASLLTAAGLPEHIAANDEGFVALCVALAGDLAALQALRSRLRGQVCASALMDETGFVRAFEAAYREIWIDWCERQV